MLDFYIENIKRNKNSSKNGNGQILNLNLQNKNLMVFKEINFQIEFVDISLFRISKIF